jgi:hypothetical protein
VTVSDYEWTMSDCEWILTDCGVGVDVVLARTSCWWALLQAVVLLCWRAGRASGKLKIPIVIFIFYFYFYFYFYF